MLKDFDQKDRRKIITILVVVAIVVVGSIIGLIFLSFKRAAEEEHQDFGVQDNSDPYAYFENLYLIQYSIAKSANNKVFLDLQDTIIRADETATAPHDNEAVRFKHGGERYVSTILENTFQRKSLDVGYAYFFDLSISDGRLYRCVLLPEAESNGSSYYGLVVYNSTSSAPKADFYVTFVTDEQSEGSDTIVKQLAAQMETLSGYSLKDAIVKK